LFVNIVGCVSRADNTGKVLITMVLTAGGGIENGVAAGHEIRRKIGRSRCAPQILKPGMSIWCGVCLMRTLLSFWVILGARSSDH
jgi:hypothetical protein